MRPQLGGGGAGAGLTLTGEFLAPKVKCRSSRGGLSAVTMQDSRRAGMTQGKGAEQGADPGGGPTAILSAGIASTPCQRAAQ